jgi:hypothetical protein
LGVHAFWEPIHFVHPFILGVHAFWGPIHFVHPLILGVHTFWGPVHCLKQNSEAKHCLNTVKYCLLVEKDRGNTCRKNQEKNQPFFWQIF